MLTFLKDSRQYSDPFIAGQRAACTIAGLTGTLLFPIVSRKLGLVRTGSWSIWWALHFVGQCVWPHTPLRSEFICLVPVVISLYVGVPVSNTPNKGPAWNATLLFGGTCTGLKGSQNWCYAILRHGLLQDWPMDVWSRSIADTAGIVGVTSTS
jgi:solute carrier family 40 (iron-regulated transporter), member 1